MRRYALCARVGGTNGGIVRVTAHFLRGNHARCNLVLCEGKPTASEVHLLSVCSATHKFTKAPLLLEAACGLLVCAEGALVAVALSNGTVYLELLIAGAWLRRDSFAEVEQVRMQTAGGLQLRAVCCYTAVAREPHHVIDAAVVVQRRKARGCRRHATVDGREERQLSHHCRRYRPRTSPGMGGFVRPTFGCRLRGGAWPKNERAMRSPICM